MMGRLHCLRSGLIALAWFAVTAGAAIAHNGEDHGTGGSTEPVWLGAAGVVVIAVLVYRLAWRDRAEPDEPASDREG